MCGNANRPPLKGSIWDDVELCENLALGIYQLRNWAGDAEYKDDKWFAKLTQVLNLPLREIYFLPPKQAIRLAEALTALLHFQGGKIHAQKSYEHIKNEYEALLPEVISREKENFDSRWATERQFISPVYGLLYRLNAGREKEPTLDRLKTLLQEVYQYLPAEKVKMYLQSYKIGQEVFDDLEESIPTMFIGTWGFTALVTRIQAMPINKIERAYALRAAVLQAVAPNEYDEARDTYDLECRYSENLWHICCGKIFSQLYRTELISTATQKRCHFLSSTSKGKDALSQVKELTQRNEALLKENELLQVNVASLEDKKRELLRKKAIIADKCEEIAALKKCLLDNGINFELMEQEQGTESPDEAEKADSIEVVNEPELSNEEVAAQLSKYLQRVKCVLVDGDDKLQNMLQARFPNLAMVNRKRIATLDALIKGADIIVCKSPSYGSHTLRKKVEQVARSAGIPFVTLSRRTNIEIVIREIFDAICKNFPENHK